MLGVDVAIPGRSEPFEFGRAVIATIASHHLRGDMEPRYRVQWAPELSGPFPRFSGELVVGGTEDYNSFVLRISGDYEPPLGLVGRGFDAAIGKHVAAATAQNLLGQLKTAIENEYRAAETAKLHVEHSA